MVPTQLTTVHEVTQAIRALVDARRDRASTRREVKPAQRRVEAGQFADLYEMRAAMWSELGKAVYINDAMSDAYGLACSVAEARDRDNAKYWRERAGRRDG